ncbi:MAG: glycosyltransferase [Bacteroidales bacterium]|nr:glycosyltransferase [Bacteroidales bacterium]
MHILYVSYDGMTDPLGQSQVLPYIIGLSGKGHQICIISAEKKDNFNLNKDKVESLIKNKNIDWVPLTYTSKPPVLSTMYDLSRMKQLAWRLHQKKKFEAVHCRSYIAALVGLYFKRKSNVPFIFDMRGFWADERIDGKIWNIRNPVFKLIYNYFKKKEKLFIKEAAHIVCLTNQGKEIVDSWQNTLIKTPISVIPCCVDTDFFSREHMDGQKIGELKSQLKIEDSDKILCYLGSIGTWYMADEMMIFFRHLSARYDHYKYLFITYEPKDLILKLAQKHGVNPEKIIVFKAARHEIPPLLCLVDISIFFIKPVFSKKASSPTKQGEIMSMGIPLICNDGIGDTTEIIAPNKAGLVLSDFNEESYTKAVENIESLSGISPAHIRSLAMHYFSLEKGIERYNFIYESLINKS